MCFAFSCVFSSFEIRPGLLLRGEFRQECWSLIILSDMNSAFHRPNRSYQVALPLAFSCRSSFVSLACSFFEHGSILSGWIKSATSSLLLGVLGVSRPKALISRRKILPFYILKKIFEKKKKKIFSKKNMGENF